MTTGTTTVTCQEIHDAARTFEDQFPMMGLDWIVDASGKAVIDPSSGLYTEIILTLRNPWTIRFEDESSAHCAVRGGTLLALDAGGDPRPVSTNYGLTINQSVSGTLIESGGGGGYPTVGQIADAVWDELAAGHAIVSSFGKIISDLPSAAAIDTELTSQHGAGNWTAAAVSVPTVGEIADAVLDEAVADHQNVGSLGHRLDFVRKALFNRLELVEGDTDNYVLYDDDDVTPIATSSVTDKDGNAISLQVGVPTLRSKGT